MIPRVLYALWCGIANTGHFLQEDRGEEIARNIIEFLRDCHQLPSDGSDKKGAKAKTVDKEPKKRK